MSRYFIALTVLAFLMAGRANICKKKAQSGTDKTRTVEWYTWEISRLEKQNQMLNVFRSVSNIHLEESHVILNEISCEIRILPS